MATEEEALRHMTATRKELVAHVASRLQDLFPPVAMGASCVTTDTRQLSMFHTSTLPRISLHHYLERLVAYGRVSNECLVQAFLNVRCLARRGHRATVEYERRSLRQQQQRMRPLRLFRNVLHPFMNEDSPRPFAVSAFNIHRLVLVMLLVCAKFTDDEIFNNAAWSTIGGIKVQELNRLEVHLLQMLRFQIWVPQANLVEAWQRLHAASLNEGMTSEEDCGPEAAAVIPAEEDAAIATSSSSTPSISVGGGGGGEVCRSKPPPTSSSAMPSQMRSESRHGIVAYS
jgi:hypothetical protein